MIAQLSVYPIGEGTSLGRFVRKGVKVIEESGYTYEIGGMSTAI
ncbi:MAG: thiamine-binding protein, partial [Deltaproteobacteria bacterium]|nr:thiamine-binding protein [Deltaproteobacteria bacterium]